MHVAFFFVHSGQNSRRVWDALSTTVLKCSPRHFMLLEVNDFIIQCPFDPMLVIFYWERYTCPEIITTRFIGHGSVSVSILNI